MSGVRPSCRSITASEKDTLNGSGLAVGSAMAALLETGQQAVGSVQLPAAHPLLRGTNPYCRRRRVICLTPTN